MPRSTTVVKMIGRGRQRWQVNCEGQVAKMKTPTDDDDTKEESHLREWSASEAEVPRQTICIGRARTKAEDAKASPSFWNSQCARPTVPGVF